MFDLLVRPEEAAWRVSPFFSSSILQIKRGRNFPSGFKFPSLTHESAFKFDQQHVVALKISLLLLRVVVNG